MWVRARAGWVATVTGTTACLTAKRMRAVTAILLPIKIACRTWTVMVIIAEIGKGGRLGCRTVSQTSFQSWSKIHLTYWRTTISTQTAATVTVPISTIVLPRNTCSPNPNCPGSLTSKLPLCLQITTIWSIATKETSATVTTVTTIIWAITTIAITAVTIIIMWI